MVCLETTFLVDLLRGKKEVEELKEQLDSTEKALAIASPTIMELWTGALLSHHKERELAKVRELLQSLQILILDEKSAQMTGEIEANLLKNGVTIGTADMMIAGIAQTNGETLVTRDAHFARIPGLRMLKY